MRNDEFLEQIYNEVKALGLVADQWAFSNMCGLHTDEHIGNSHSHPDCGRGSATVGNAKDRLIAGADLCSGCFQRDVRIGLASGERQQCGQWAGFREKCHESAPRAPAGAR